MEKDIVIVEYRYCPFTASCAKYIAYHGVEEAVDDILGRMRDCGYSNEEIDVARDTLEVDGCFECDDFECVIHDGVSIE